MHKRIAARAALIFTLLSLSCAALAANVVRYPLPNGEKFPISLAVAVPAGTTLVYYSGGGPSPHDRSATEGSPQYWGDTKAQTISTLESIKTGLAKMGLSFADTVKMNAYLVADPAMGHMDFAGFMQGYTQFFGTAEQPNLPARTTVQVAGLAEPGVLVEIELVLASKAAPRAPAK
jgi:enamine deaminase RidA (YjgF/YER057c/UK114 family)